MDLLNGMAAFSVKDRQHCISMLNIFEGLGITDIRFVRQSLQRDIDAKYTATIKKSKKYQPDNITSCSACGKSAIVVPLSSTDRTNTATHAIQCQNRPATDRPWRDGMCGHTEYIVRSDR